MSRASMLAAVQAFVGRPTNDCIDWIKETAALNHYSVLIFIRSSIPNRSTATKAASTSFRTKRQDRLSFSIG